MTASLTTTPAIPAIMPSEILAAFDYSEPAWSVVPLAQRLADRLGAALTFARVDSSSPRPFGPVGRLQLRIARDGGQVEIDVAAGREVALVLSEFAGDRPSVLLAIGTHGRVAVSDLAWASVCAELVAKRQLPVLAVGPSFNQATHSSVEEVVVCVDPVRPDRTRVELAGLWAESLGKPLTILAAKGGGPTPPNVDGVQRFVDGMVGDVVDVHHKCDPARAIVGYARQRQGRLLMMSIGSRTDRDHTMGGVTGRVLRHTPSGVLLVPEGESNSGTGP